MGTINGHAVVARRPHGSGFVVLAVAPDVYSTSGFDYVVGTLDRISSHIFTTSESTDDFATATAAFNRI